MIEGMFSSEPVLRQRQSDNHSQLLSLLRSMDCEDLIARLSLTEGIIDPNTPETQSSTSPAHAEYVALQVIGYEIEFIETDDFAEQSSKARRVIELVKEMFEVQHQLIWVASLRENREGKTDPARLRQRSQTESLRVRGSSYFQHKEHILHGCFDMFDLRCSQQIGFTISDALEIVKSIGGLMGSRLNYEVQRSRIEVQETLRQLKIARRKQRPNEAIGEDLLRMSPSQAKMRIQYLGAEWVLAHSRSIAFFSVSDIVEASKLRPEVCKSFIDAFTFDKSEFIEDHHKSPTGAHPLSERPIVQVGEEFIMPAPSAMLDALRVRIEDLISETDFAETYLKQRGEYLASEAANRMAKALPGASMSINIPWASNKDDSDLDGLVWSDDFAARLQCKAGRIRQSTRRGAPRSLETDIHKLITDASNQHIALCEALAEQRATEIGFSPEQEEALRATIQIEVIVCLDEVTVWATESRRLQDAGHLPSDRLPIWVVSLSDLMAVTDLLQGAQLVHYLLRRRRLELDGRISAHDELDWVGNYILQGLYFDDIASGNEQYDSIFLSSFTDEIDAWYNSELGILSKSVQKPSQAIPVALERLIGKLSRQRPKHWIVASVGLLDGSGEFRNKWNYSIPKVEQRAISRGASNVSFISDGRIGLSYYVDTSSSASRAMSDAASAAKVHIAKGDASNWVTICRGSNGDLRVAVIESGDPPSIAEALA
jgi:hypothetical protein